MKYNVEFVCEVCSCDGEDKVLVNFDSFVQFGGIFLGRRCGMFYCQFRKVVIEVGICVSVIGIDIWFL